MLDQFSPIGDNSRPKVKGYYFSVYEWVNKFENVISNNIIDPKDYFVTSGEAVIKCSVLENDLWSNYKELYINYNNSKSEDVLKCMNKCWKTACQSTHLTINLIEARGTYLFLETDWYDGFVICYPKNPRGIKL